MARSNPGGAARRRHGQLDKDGVLARVRTCQGDEQAPGDGAEGVTSTGSPRRRDEWVAVRWCPGPPGRRRPRWLKLLTRRRSASLRRQAPVGGHGWAEICTSVPALVDTNVLVYRFDAISEAEVATELLRRGWWRTRSASHQAVVFAAVTPAGRWPLAAHPTRRGARRGFRQFVILYPTETLLRTPFGMGRVPARLVRCPLGTRRSTGSALVSEDFSTTDCTGRRVVNHS